MTPEQVNAVGGDTSADSFEDNDLLHVTWLGLEWHVVVKTGEQDVVVEWVFISFPFLPGTAVLSSGNEDQISGLYEDTLVFELLNLASVVEVNKNNLGSVEGDVVLETVFFVLGFACVIVGNGVWGMANSKVFSVSVTATV